MLEPSLTKNDTKAKWLIGIFSVVVFTAIILLSRYKLEVDLGFNIHIFATCQCIHQFNYCCIIDSGVDCC
jgi:putative membrane protein